jgi:hypothetical protein
LSDKGLSSVLSDIYKIPPLYKGPPSTQLPDPTDEPTWYGKVLIEYPRSQLFVPLQHCHVQRARDFGKVV